MFFSTSGGQSDLFGWKHGMSEGVNEMVDASRGTNVFFKKTSGESVFFSCSL